jgi:DNA-binding HxlR family transcriptional regulator
MEKSKSVKIDVDENCPVRGILDRFGDKWSTLILLLLDESPVLRFNEIYKMIPGISQKMLTVSLKTLEEDGLVKRTVYPQIPPRVDYELTPRGMSLLPHIQNLVKWANENRLDILQSRETHRL